MLERINAWLIGRLPSRRAARRTRLRMSVQGLHVDAPAESRLIEWRQIDRVVATSAEQLVGSTHVLVFGVASGEVLTISEDHPDWTTVTRGLTDWLPGAKRFEVWALELIASPPCEISISGEIGMSGEIEIFRRSPAPRPGS